MQLPHNNQIEYICQPPKDTQEQNTQRTIQATEMIVILLLLFLCYLFLHRLFAKPTNEIDLNNNNNNSNEITRFFFLFHKTHNHRLGEKALMSVPNPHRFCATTRLRRLRRDKNKKREGIIIIIIVVRNYENASIARHHHHQP